jgi:D-sedoheptulose 7-phosphate isomerase
MIETARAEGRHIFIIGNGGSAATASHFACDLNKTARAMGWPRFRAMALTDNVPIITALANDDAYSSIFVEQLVNFLERGDLLIVFSGSGKSENVVRALAMANEMDANSIAITGGDGGFVKIFATHTIIVPSKNMQKIEDVHMMIVHLIITNLIEEKQ